MEEFSTKSDVFYRVSKTLAKRFTLAFSAPSMSGELYDDIGFLGDTLAAQQILEGTYTFPADCDPATRLLLEEAARTYAFMSTEEIATYVTVEDFQYYWQRANERISSSYSGLHFGHYKAAAFDYHLSALHAQKLTLCARKGVPLARWGRGLTVLLEKICGDNYVNRLRAICLFEADFNWWNKLVFARRMMENARRSNALPDEIFAKKGTQCIVATMSKIFFSDVSKVMHHPASIESCDFSDCYDRVVHNIQAIGLRAFKMPKPSVNMFLMALEIMQFFLRTGHGESEQSYGGTADSPYMGLGQGNGGAPPAFTVDSVLLINAYRRLGHGATLTSALAARIFLLSAVLYVDDGDLLHWGSSSVQTDEEHIEQVQEATTDYGMLAQATGGALKPKKCGTYFMFYKFVQGRAKLKRLKEFPEPLGEVMKDDGKGGTCTAPAHLRIPQVDGSEAPIESWDINHPSKMLGVYFTPVGNGKPHMTAMRQKGLDWNDLLLAKPLPSRDA